MKYTIEKANQYITSKLHHVNDAFKPHFHVAPPIGWINDPNGFVRYRGRYHLFFQYHPYGPNWGPMHWGHVISDDLIKFELAPIALAPDTDDEHGCFSGGAIVDVHNPSKLFLSYTKHYENGIVIEQQNIATSQDGITFKKLPNPILTEKDLPKNASINEFRDPRPIFIDPYYYLLIGSSQAGIGQILVYRSIDMIEFKYHFTIGPHKLFGTMGECPDLTTINGFDVLIVSATSLPSHNDQYLNKNSSLAFLGKFDIVNKSYRIDSSQEIDRGHAFYAPQITQSDSGEPIMTAWMNMWDKPNYTQRFGLEWSGSLILPRVLSIRDGLLVQMPISSLDSYRSNRYEKPFDAPIKKQFDWNIIIKSGAVFEWRIANEKDENDYFAIRSDGITIEVDASRVKKAPFEPRRAPCRKGQTTRIRIISDTSSIEIFIDDGRYAITTLVYVDSKDYIIRSLFGDAAILDSELFELDIKKENLNETSITNLDDRVAL